MLKMEGFLTMKRCVHQEGRTMVNVYVCYYKSLEMT